MTFNLLCPPSLTKKFNKSKEIFQQLIYSFYPSIFKIRLKTFWTFCIYHCIQEIEKKDNLNILFHFLVPVTSVLQPGDILVRSFNFIILNCSSQWKFVRINLILLLSQEYFFCARNIAHVIVVFPLREMPFFHVFLLYQEIISYNQNFLPLKRIFIMSFDRKSHMFFCRIFIMHSNCMHEFST